jgi:UDP-glucose 4-epimerase
MDTNKIKTVLVTGGAGYIGSHTCVELLSSGFKVVVLDNLSNSNSISLDRVNEITGSTLTFVKGDIRDEKALSNIFEKQNINAVMHFAGRKAVAESMSMPLAYYQNNVAGTLTLLESMNKYDVKDIVFSSSATVYGNAGNLPINETFPLSTTSPYGRSKLFIEHILEDICGSDTQWNASILRYFNPVGAHESGLIGEDPNGTPNNLMPHISQVAIGKLDKLTIYGGDYPTKDGTGIRDYIHVVDLAKGHIKALEKLIERPGFIIHNLGTGQGYSVLEMIKAFETASGKKIPYQISGRRKGDVAICYADPSLSEKDMGWLPDRKIDEMCRDSWNWQQKNPNGYI